MTENNNYVLEILSSVRIIKLFKEELGVTFGGKVLAALSFSLHCKVKNNL